MFLAFIAKDRDVQDVSNLVSAGDREPLAAKHAKGDSAVIETDPLACEGIASLADLLHEGIWIIDQDHRICFGNQAFVHILGYTVEEVLALSTEQVRDLVHPADRERVWWRHDKRLAGHTALETYEARLYTKTGLG